MGMFDMVKYSCKCPNCGHKLTNFQTKDTDCQLSVVRPSNRRVNNFYDGCDQCGAFITINIERGAIQVRKEKKRGQHG